MRLDKFLADVLKISRQDAKKIIKNKEVKINSELTTNINISISKAQLSLRYEKLKSLQ